MVHGKFPADPSVTSIVANVDGRPDRSHISLLSYNATKHATQHATQQQSFLDVTIETGRKHQIRRHLAGLGFSVVGDRLYGATERATQANSPMPDLQLQACSLAFTCPLTGTQRSYSLNTA